MTIHSPIMQQLGRFYLVRASFRYSTYLAECDNLPFGKDWSEAEGLALLDQTDDAEAIYEVCEGKFSDVSKHFAELMMQREAETFDPASDTWPAFVQRYISPSRLQDIEEEIRAEDYAHRAHVREISVPSL